MSSEGHDAYPIVLHMPENGPPAYVNWERGHRTFYLLTFVSALARLCWWATSDYGVDSGATWRPPGGHLGGECSGLHHGVAFATILAVLRPHNGRRGGVVAHCGQRVRRGQAAPHEELRVARI